MEEIFDYLADNLKNEILRYEPNLQDIEEIRIRSKKPIILKNSEGNKMLIHIVSKEELLETFQKVCEHSIYSYQKQICEGFITIKGGHRVGITGSSVIEDGKIININYISSLNFRIAREKKDISRDVLKSIIKDNGILIAISTNLSTGSNNSNKILNGKNIHPIILMKTSIIFS